MAYDKMDIYAKIYHTVDENLRRHGGQLPFSLELYEGMVGKNPFALDAREYTSRYDIGRRNAFFYRFTNSLPSRATIELYNGWAEKLGYTSDVDYDLFVLAMVKTLKEFRSLDKTVVGIVDAQDARSRDRKIIRDIQLIYFRDTVLKYTVFPIWDLFSDENKNKIRRLFGRREK